jgi:UDP-glucose 4-epimerase
MKIEGNKFVITGGVSLIGSHVSEHLLARGAREVVLFDNYSLGSPEAVEDILRDNRVKLVRGDILRVNELFDALDGAAGVFAVAGFLTLPLSQNPGLGLSVNVQGHVNVLEACRYRGVKRVVFSSSIAVYGEADVDAIDEATPLQWQTLQPATALYAASKIIGESLGGLYQRRHGIESVSLRYSTVYGERQHYRGVNALFIMENYERVARGERPVISGDGGEVHDYIHVGDVARANVMAMASEAPGGSFNVVTGADTTLNDVVRTLLKVMGSSLDPEYATAASAVKSSSSRRLNLSRDRVEAAIGWKPEVSLEEGIRRFVAWREAQRPRVPTAA